MTAALVAESARRSRVCWLSYAYDEAGDRVRVEGRLVWHLWHEDALVVLSCPGPAEQVLPGIDRTGRVEVTMRSKDTKGRLLTWTGMVEVVEVGTASWSGHVEALLGVRLNLPDVDAAREDWAEHGIIVRIRPLPAPVG
ncbi:MAG: hypothetical protein AVDCRST_MAG34-1136 [uncultured Nocardioidaceae bacterium]|uniref:Pyridoxamine 5'-phosphate oxidase putative domain-containing protein n=1 Tax=uncultured Nocardioidaceae bacterium TaxID=253824 RepID=A0A6J4LX59_9ACTN|nr:MAG: hypothetical protein AVDCRST_MAG34-1136 [uncultured Nocardioidaceae bacterium]